MVSVVNNMDVVKTLLFISATVCVSSGSTINVCSVSDNSGRSDQCSSTFHHISSEDGAGVVGITTEDDLQSVGVDGLCEGLTVTVEGRFCEAESRYHINFVSGEWSLLHVDLRFAYGNWQKIAIVNSIFDNHWGHQQTLEGFPFQPGYSYVVKIAIIPDFFEITGNEAYMGKFHHREDLLSLAKVDKIVVAGCGRVGRITVTRAHCGQGDRGGDGDRPTGIIPKPGPGTHGATDNNVCSVSDNRERSDQCSRTFHHITSEDRAGVVGITGDGDLQSVGVDGLCEGLTVTVEGRFCEAESRYHINFVSGNWSLLHVDLRFHYGNWQKIAIVNSIFDNHWGHQQTLEGFPFQPGHSYVVKIAIIPDFFEITGNEAYMGKFHHREDLLSLAKVDKIVVAGCGRVGRITVTRAHCGQGNGDGDRPSGLIPKPAHRGGSSGAVGGAPKSVRGAPSGGASGTVGVATEPVRGSPSGGATGGVDRGSESVYGAFAPQGAPVAAPDNDDSADAENDEVGESPDIPESDTESDTAISTPRASIKGRADKLMEVLQGVFANVSGGMNVRVGEWLVFVWCGVFVVMV